MRAVQRQSVSLYGSSGYCAPSCGIGESLKASWMSIPARTGFPADDSVCLIACWPASVLSRSLASLLNDWQHGLPFTHSTVRNSARFGCRGAAPAHPAPLSSNLVAALPHRADSTSGRLWHANRATSRVGTSTTTAAGVIMQGS
jgi:hypothetical protein